MDYNYDLEAFNVMELANIKRAEVGEILNALKLSSVSFLFC